MFQWDKTINAINIGANKIVHLFRSMRDLQLALPGLSAQQASAFLCQYHVEGGIATVAIFHLHKSEVLAFYCSDPRVVLEQETDSMLCKGLDFVESMGFLMTDQDFHLLDVADQEKLWASLPIKTGLTGERELLSEPAAGKNTEEKLAARIRERKVETVQKEKTETAASLVNDQAIKGAVVAEPDKITPEHQSKSETGNVDELLAAVEAMRAKRPGSRERKLPPSAEEIERRRQQLRETVGRILASL
ncbi:MAG: hypothetical protein RQ722_01710 [Desulfuromonadales bacterium]|nr:hypothetical protein [Desulfuromonadales bacterium]